MTKIYPSSIGKIQGASIIGYNSSCLRYQAVSDILPRFQIDPIYQAIGLIGEKRHIARIDNSNLKIEVPIKVDIGGGDIISGRMDAIDEINGIIYEFKTTISKSKRKDLAVGRIPFYWLGQLLTYMILKDVVNGRLCASYAHFDLSLGGLQFEDFIYKVQICGDTVEVDNVPQDISLKDIIQYYRLVQRARHSKELAPRIINNEACKSCPLQKICDANAKDRDEFNRLVNESAIEAVPLSYTPKINVHE